MLVGEALKGGPRQGADQRQVRALRDPAGAFAGFDGRPAAVKNFIAYSLQRLGVDHIDIYARPGSTGCADRRYGGRHRRRDQGRWSAISACRGRGRHDPPRRRRAPDRRSADRIFPDLPRYRGQDPARLPRARHRRHRYACCRAA